MTRSLLHDTLHNARETLLAARNPAGHWEGELSTSALSTATSIVALGSVDENLHQDLLRTATGWLVSNQNLDGGWGDTVKSFSNISTTLLCWSALRRFGDTSSTIAVQKASWWIQDYVGSLNPELIAETVKARYGKDRTFSVPILMLCAICGTLGKRGWHLVPPASVSTGRVSAEVVRHPAASGRELRPSRAHRDRICPLSQRRRNEETSAFRAPPLVAPLTLAHGDPTRIGRFPRSGPVDGICHHGARRGRRKKSLGRQTRRRLFVQHRPSRW